MAKNTKTINDLQYEEDVVNIVIDNSIKDNVIKFDYLDIRVIFNKDDKLIKLDSSNNKNTLYVYNNTKTDYIILDSFDRVVLTTNIDYKNINKMFFINKTKKLELGIDIDLFVEDMKIKVLITNISKVRVQLNANSVIGQLEFFN